MKTRNSRRLPILIACLLALSAAIPGASVFAQALPAGAKSEVQNRQVRMYVLPDCGYCERARVYLRERGVDWQEIDIASSVQAKAEFDALGGAGTPLIFIGEERVAGFNVARLDQLLGP